MKHALRHPVIITCIVAIVSTVTLAAIVVIDRSDYSKDKRQAPPGTTFNTVNNMGGSIAPTVPKSPITPPSLVWTPLENR